MTRTLTATLLLLTLTLVPACGSGTTDSHEQADDVFDGISKAVCVLTPTTGSDELTGVSGTVTLTQTKQGLRVQATISGLKPNAKHGFHVHQFGDLSKPDGTGAGGHYNPEANDEHSLPKEEDHGDHTDLFTGGHAGDLGNLESDAGGNASYDQTFANISLTGKNAVLARGIIVHLNEDDGGQPTGNAGARVAQGVIGIANSE